MKKLLSNRLVQTGAISALCVAGYFGLRSIPVYNCGFLHASAPLRTESSPNDEFCEVGNSGFIDLSRSRYAIESSVSQNAEGQFQLSLRTLSGRPISFGEIAITHTERIHLLVVDESLNDYHHVHPQPTEENGIFTFHFDAAPDRIYRFIAEFVPQRTQTQVIAETRFTPGKSSPATVLTASDQEVTGRHTNLIHSQQGNRLRTQKGDYQFELILPFSGLNPTGENEVLLRISAGGQPVPLQEIMGAYAHLVAFDHAGKGFAHFHPVLEKTLNPLDSNRTHPSIPFIFEGMESGEYRVWVQVKLEGREYFVPFDLRVTGIQEI